MLVLSRQRDESIVIGDEIEITVVDIRGDKVRLGISAPREIQVHRKEVYEAIKRENTDASRVQIDDLTRMNGNLRAGGVRRPLPGNGSARPMGSPLAGPATPGVPKAAALPGSVPGPVPGNGQR